MAWEPGSERLMNGYLAIKLDDGSWQYKHRILAEKKLGRPLSGNERVFFKDGDKTNLDPDNLEIRWQSPARQYKKRAHLRREILKTQAKLTDLQEQLERLGSTMDDGPIAISQEGRGGRSYQ